MSSFRQIPLHMLLLAGLVGPLAAQEKKAAESAARPAAVAPKVGYAGLHVADLSEQDRSATPALPPGLGIRVGFVDPAGPSVGSFEEGDIITRFDDQVIVNREQFRTLVRLRKPGEKVRLTIVRGSEPKVVSLKLGEARSAAITARKVAPQADAQAFSLGEATEPAPQAGPDVTQIGPNSVVIIGPNAGLPEEVRQRLREMRSRGLQFPPDITADVAPDSPVPRAAQRSSSRSFSFGTGGLSSTSSSIAVDGEGSVALEEKDGKKHATIKDAAGKVTFEGEVTTPEQRAKLTEAVRRRLKLVEGGTFSVPGFEASPSAEGTAVPPKEEPPAKPRKRKFKPEEGA